ncbi:hypothetical protein [Nocardioides sp.]|uniref:hypothetical protein n=1 Tax=Nocardioides sp. TaxID=35761 RepID=UPI00378325C5
MSEQTLVRELERRAGDVHGAPLTLDAVRGRARSIRRRRRAAAAGAVAAVVALVLVLPAVLGGHHERAVEPAPAPRGHTAVLHDGVVTRADGSRVRIGVDSADVTNFAALADGRVVVALQQPYAVRVYAADGSRQAQYAVQANVVTASNDGTAVAWVAEDFTIRVLRSGVARPVERPGIPMPGEAVGTIDAVVDADLLLVGDGARTTSGVTPDGEGSVVLPTGLPRNARVSDISPDGTLWALDFVPGPDEQFGCAGLFDLDTYEVVARTCETSSLRFSPDGQHLLGTRGDNNMVGEVQVLDLDLKRVWSSRLSGAVVSRSAWADDDEVLLATTDLSGRDWQLVRERALPPLDDLDPVVVDGPAPGGNPEIVAEYQFSD